MTAPNLLTGWFAEKILEHDRVTGASKLANGHVEVARRNLPEVTIAPVTADRIDVAMVEHVLASGTPTEVVLIPRVGHYDWDARKLAEGRGSTVHTFKELFASLDQEDPRAYVDGNVSFVNEGLAQHSRVRGVEMICEASMRIMRSGNLSDVVCAIEYEYEFSEEALMQAIKRHPDANVVVNSNPNGKPTTAALQHAKEAQVPVFGFGQLMGALNFDGKHFREYTPPRHR